MTQRGPQPTDDRPQGRWSIGQPWGLAALTVAVASPVSLAAGTVALLTMTGAAEAAEECGENSMWCGLGPILIGAFVGLGTATVSNLGVARMLIRRFRPPGQRLGAFVIHVAATLVLLLVVAELRQLLALLR